MRASNHWLQTGSCAVQCMSTLFPVLRHSQHCRQYTRAAELLGGCICTSLTPKQYSQHICSVVQRTRHGSQVLFWCAGCSQAKIWSSPWRAAASWRSWMRSTVTCPQEHPRACMWPAQRCAHCCTQSLSRSHHQGLYWTAPNPPNLVVHATDIPLFRTHRTLQIWQPAGRKPCLFTTLGVASSIARLYVAVLSLSAKHPLHQDVSAILAHCSCESSLTSRFFDSPCICHTVMLGC